MSLSAWVGKERYGIGDASLLKAWFSTVHVRLENEGWGCLFPTIMRQLYGGSLPHGRAGEALEELRRIRQRLTEFPPDRVVWDFENLEARPPWGDRISPHIVSLANYFVTSDGKDLTEVLASALAQAARSKQDVVIS